MDLNNGGKRETGNEQRKARAVTISVAVALCVGACSGGEAPKSRPAMTQRQRDSAIGEMKLPGAQGVRRALRAQDSAQARVNRLDTIQ